MCFKYLISTIKNSLEIGHINLGKWGQQREKKIFPSKNFAWVTARTQVPEMAQTSPCLLMGEQHESVAPALLRQREGCWCCAGALRKIGLAFEVGRAWECCTTFILGAGTCWNSNYWETGLRQSEALPLPCKEVQFFYLKLVFLTSPNVKKQWSQATPASLPGKPGKVKWGLLLDSPTSAAVTEGFKKKPKQTNLSTGKTCPNVCFERKRVWKRGVWAYLSLILPLPSTPPTSVCHIRLPHLSGSLPATLRPLCHGWQHGWKLQGSEERQGEPFPLQAGSSCCVLSSGSSTRLSLQQGPSAPHPSWWCASRHALLIGKGSPKTFPHTPIFMAAVDAWIKAILSNCLGLCAPLCHPSIPGQPPLPIPLCLPKPPLCVSALSLC